MKNFFISVWFLAQADPQNREWAEVSLEEDGGFRVSKCRGRWYPPWPSTWEEQAVAGEF